VQWKPRTVFKLAVAAYVLAGAAGVAAAFVWAGAWAQTAAACYVAGLWLVVIVLILLVLPPVRRDWTADNIVLSILWGAAIAGCATLLAVYRFWNGVVYEAAIIFLLCYWLVAAFYLARKAPPEEWIKRLKALTTGITFSAMSVSVTYHFSPAVSVLVALALFAIGLLAGMLITVQGASFIMGLGVLSLLLTGLGYSLGDLYGNKGAFVVGMFCISILLGLMLPPLPNFQRALLATLVTVAVGMSGALLGTALGAPMPWALGFLAFGAFASILMNEERAISLSLFSVLSAVMMSLGFSAAFYTGYAWYWVGGLFCLSALIYVFSRAPRVRLALLLAAPLALFVGAGYIIGNTFGLAFWTVPIMFGLALLFEVIFYFASDSRILGLNDAWVVSEQDCPRAYAITRRLSAAAGLSPPRIALIGSDTPNLFTVGRSPSRAVIAVTQGLLDGFDDDELEALLAHELAHIREKDLLTMTLATAFASVMGAGVKAIVFDNDKGANQLTLLLVGLTVPFFALLVQLSNPRSREKRADAGAVRMTRKKEALAGALEKLELGADLAPLEANPATGPLFAVNPFRTGWLVAMFSTHPTTEERVDLLRKALPAGG